MSGTTAAQVDRAVLAAIEAQLRGGEFFGVHSVVVLHRGETIAEWHRAGRDSSIFVDYGEVTFTPNRLHDIRSITKNVVGLLIGIARGEGALEDLDAPVVDFFPEYAALVTADRRRITLRHMLTMTSGFAWDERTYPYSDPRNSEIAMATSGDPYRYVLTQPIAAAAGDRFTYSGGDVEVMAAVLTRASATPIAEFAREKLFAPLGVEHFEWIDNRGVPMAASGLRLAPRDLARLGALVLNGGNWNGRQIVPADWIEESIATHAYVDPGDPECGTRYGYFWWLGPGCEIRPRTPWIAGFGNGGQRLWIVPSRDLVVASTAGLYDDPRQSDGPTRLFGAVLAAVPPAQDRREK